jgi:hypothetical protein
VRRHAENGSPPWSHFAVDESPLAGSQSLGRSALCQGLPLVRSALSQRATRVLSRKTVPKSGLASPVRDCWARVGPPKIRCCESACRTAATSSTTIGALLAMARVLWKPEVAHHPSQRPSTASEMTAEESPLAQNPALIRSLRRSWSFACDDVVFIGDVLQHGYAVTSAKLSSDVTPDSQTRSKARINTRETQTRHLSMQDKIVSVKRLIDAKPRFCNARERRLSAPLCVSQCGDVRALQQQS